MEKTNSKESKLFGTDGIRGTPGIYPLTDGMIFKIGESVARFISYKKDREKAKVIIGKDTRLTGQIIETIISNALRENGIDVYLAGIITTPGLSFLIKDLEAEMGIMISASHNKAADNGIKFFTKGGYKLSHKEEEWIENIIFNSLIKEENFKHNRGAGEVFILEEAQSKYIHFLLSTVKGLKLDGIKIAFDCAWGAASPFVEELFNKLGAKIKLIHNVPSGERINMGGSTDPSVLAELVLDSKMDIGIALDGDGDRVIFVDSKGTVCDGDVIMAIIAKQLIKQNRLPNNKIVATVMSNLGLKNAINKQGGDVIFTKVGDKNVLDELIKHNLILGGEQSGHIIFLDYLPTPDGLLTALNILKIIKETGLPLDDLSSCINKFPQILVNIKVKEKKPFEEISSVWEKFNDFNSRLEDKGRILLRYSGTELLARVMVEGEDKDLIENIAFSLADQIKEEIGYSSDA